MDGFGYVWNLNGIGKCDVGNEYWGNFWGGVILWLYVC